MDVSPPKKGTWLLPWEALPHWLRWVRVLDSVALAGAFLCWAALFTYQLRVLSSPRAPIGAYTHAVHFKGATFYLAGPLFAVWTTANVAGAVFLVTVISMAAVSRTFEGRIQRRQWDAYLKDVSERLDHSSAPSR